MDRSCSFFDVLKRHLKLCVMWWIKKKGVCKSGTHLSFYHVMVQLKHSLFIPRRKVLTKIKNFAHLRIRQCRGNDPLLFHGVD